jgi:hypothetical protein
VISSSWRKRAQGLCIAHRGDPHAWRHGRDSWAIYIGAGYLFTTSSGPRLAGTAPSHFSLPAAIALGFGGVIAVYLGTQLGRFARGDFD